MIYSLSMSELKFRPRFRIETTLSENEVAEIIKTKLKDDNKSGFGSTIVEGHLILKIPKKDQHFWSPQMDISLSNQEDKEGTLIRCLLAPKPSVWTMFMFFYAASGFAAFIGLMILMSQYTLDKEMWASYIVVISLLIGILLFVIAQFGKGIAKEQMQELKSFVTEINWK